MGSENDSRFVIVQIVCILIVGFLIVTGSRYFSKEPAPSNESTYAPITSSEEIFSHSRMEKDPEGFQEHLKIEAQLEQLWDMYRKTNSRDVLKKLEQYRKLGLHVYGRPLDELLAVTPYR